MISNENSKFWFRIKICNSNFHIKNGNIRFIHPSVYYWLSRCLHPDCQHRTEDFRLPINLNRIKSRFSFPMSSSKFNLKFDFWVLNVHLRYQFLILMLNFAKLSPAQSNFNSVGWAELALIPTFTNPQGKYWEGNFNTVIGQTTKVGLWGHPSLMTSVPVVN